MLCLSGLLAGGAQALEIRTWDLDVNFSTPIFPATATVGSYVQHVQGFNATQFTTNIATPSEAGIDFLIEANTSFVDGATITFHDFKFPTTLWSVDAGITGIANVAIGVDALFSGAPIAGSTIDLTGTLDERGSSGVFDVTFNPFTVYWLASNINGSATGSFEFFVSTEQQTVVPLQTNPDPSTGGLDCDAPSSIVNLPGTAATNGLDPNGNFTLYGLACPTGLMTAIGPLINVSGVQEDIFSVQLTGSIVPEPTTLVLMMGGLMGLGFQGRRRTV